MPIQIADHRWTLDTLEQLTVSGPTVLSGATTISGALTTSGGVTNTVGGVGTANVYRAATVAASAAINTTETVLLAMTAPARLSVPEIRVPVVKLTVRVPES